MSNWTPGSDTVETVHGLWNHNRMYRYSSNFRELLNIVLEIGRMDEEGKIDAGHEFFVFTDNYHAEAAFHRGTAKSRDVYLLMLRLHKIIMQGSAFIHVI